MNFEPRTGNRLNDDLSALSQEDLARVIRWVEDRFINAIAPLAIRLQMELPGVIAADASLQAAQKAVAKVMAGVEEIRGISKQKAAGSRQKAAGSGRNPECPGKEDLTFPKKGLKLGFDVT